VRLDPINRAEGLGASPGPIVGSRDQLKVKLSKVSPVRPQRAGDIWGFQAVV
jgi:hypothetical protein